MLLCIICKKAQSLYAPLIQPIVFIQLYDYDIIIFLLCPMHERIGKDHEKCALFPINILGFLYFSFLKNPPSICLLTRLFILAKKRASLRRKMPVQLILL